MGMHNKGTYTRVLTYAYTHIDIRVYAKYERIIRVCVVRIYLSCTVPPLVSFLARQESRLERRDSRLARTIEAYILEYITSL